MIKKPNRNRSRTSLVMAILAAARISTILAVLALAVSGCTSGSGSGPTGPELGDLISAGWLAFEQGDYAAASTQFGDAVVRFPNAAKSYSGLGWSLFRLDDLNRSRDEFLLGATKASPSADLFAGLAFVLNALKSYSDSNTHADMTLALDGAWQFSHDPTLSAADLHVLKAENHFLSGEFALALSEVMTLNPGFSVDIATAVGQADLAMEIERLKGES